VSASGPLSARGPDADSRHPQAGEGLDADGCQQYSMPQRRKAAVVSASEALWAFGLLAILLLSLVVFQRVRGRTRDFEETMTFKERLPGWVRAFESITLCSLIVAATVGAMWGTFQLVPDMKRAVGVVAIYGVMGSLLVSVPVACLAANLVSWLIPPVRTANSRAMLGLRISFLSVNRGLLWFGGVSIPLGVALIAIAAIAPWR
jgi:hypothetical protein